MSEAARHPMAVVTRRTGLRPDLIRAWERRYGAVTPSRSSGNHRLYTDADIRRLNLLRRGTDAGFRIHRLAPLSDSEVEALVGTEPAERRSSRGSHRASARTIVRECFERVVALDVEGLEHSLESAAVDLSRVDLTDSVLVPLMQQVGEACQDGRCRIANEHLAATVVRSFLGSMRGAYPVGDSAPAIVVTTPAHQYHEVAAMIVTATARSEGWRAVYLGANTPAEDIVSAAITIGARVIAISITWPQDDADLREELRRLGRLMPKETILIAGGRGAAAYADALDSVGAERPADLDGFRRLLSKIRAPRPHQETR